MPDLICHNFCFPKKTSPAPKAHIQKVTSNPMFYTKPVKNGTERNQHKQIFIKTFVFKGSPMTAADLAPV